jgi:hypothetical protein
MGPQFPSRRQPDQRTAIQAAHPSPTRWPSAVSVEPVGERRTTPVRRHDRSGTPLDRGVRETHCAQERAQRVHRGFKVGPGKLRDQHESGGRRTRRTSGTVNVPAGNEPEPRPSLRIVYRVELPEFDIDGVQFTSDSGAVRSGLCPSDQRRFPGAALPQGDDPGVNVDGGYRTRCLHALGVGPLDAFLVPTVPVAVFSPQVRGTVNMLSRPSVMSPRTELRTGRSCGQRRAHAPARIRPGPSSRPSGIPERIQGAPRRHAPTRTRTGPHPGR